MGCPVPTLELLANRGIVDLQDLVVLSSLLYGSLNGSSATESHTDGLVGSFQVGIFSSLEFLSGRSHRLNSSLLGSTLLDDGLSLSRYS